jgi:cytoskeletal protein RodZ
MSDELLYTSAPRGLRPGTSGFCTVAATPALGPAWTERLEGISGYKPLYPAGDPRECQNPIAFVHSRLTVAGQTRSVLTRVCFSGFDHTGRSNKFAHHVLPTDAERSGGGPAWTMLQPNFMTDAWDGGEPRLISSGRQVPAGRPGPAKAQAWGRVTGDPGWAAVLAYFAIENPTAIVYVIYEAGTDILLLFEEAIRLLPEAQRWLVTFNTYVTDSASANGSAWRGVIAGTPAAAMARGNVIDLTSPDMSLLESTSMVYGSLVEAARTGNPAKPLPPSARPEEAASSPSSGLTRPVPGSRSKLPVTRGGTSAIPLSPGIPSSVPRTQSGMPANVRFESQPRRSGIKLGLIIGIPVALFLLIVGGVTLLAFKKKSKPPANDIAISSAPRSLGATVPMQHSPATQPTTEATTQSADNTTTEPAIPTGDPPPPTATTQPQPTPTTREDSLSIKPGDDSLMKPTASSQPTSSTRPSDDKVVTSSQQTTQPAAPPQPPTLPASAPSPLSVGDLEKIADDPLNLRWNVTNIASISLDNLSEKYQLSDASGQHWVVDMKKGEKKDDLKFTLDNTFQIKKLGKGDFEFNIKIEEKEKHRFLNCDIREQFNRLDKNKLVIAIGEKQYKVGRFRLSAYGVKAITIEIVADIPNTLSKATP